MSDFCSQQLPSERENGQGSCITSFDIFAHFSKVQSGLEFILRHFSSPLFPRKISTAATDKRQYEALDKDQAMVYFQASLWEDCRIAGFSVNQTNPDLIFIDLDTKDFASMRSFKLALTATLKNIKQKLGGAHPTVLWSGRGYHIIQPIDCRTPLEQIKELVALEPETSKKFLQFAERYLSNDKCDSSNNPSIKSCMLRVPGSLNSKCKAAGIGAEVKILQKWDGYRPDFRLLVGNFCAYLVGKNNRKAAVQGRASLIPSASDNAASIPWIEKLLTNTPIEEGRKIAVALILSRYLINVRKLGYDQAYSIIWEWLDRCAALKRLEPSKNHFEHYIVRYQLEEAARSKRLPMKLETLREYNPDLYEKLNLSREA